MIYKKSIQLILLLIVVISFQNCADSGESSTNTASSSSISQRANFVWLNENIIQPKCLECHSATLAFGGLEFTSYQGVLEAVAPGDPLSSPLYTRSFSTTFFELTDEERAVIRVWIENGATD